MIQYQHIPVRTFYTALDDNILLLFDVLFDGRCQKHRLYKSNYSNYNNLPYTHNLDVINLDVLLENLILQSLLEIRNVFTGARKVNFYGLTSQGGDLWERERRPDWEKYCDCSWWTNDVSEYFSVMSPSIVSIYNCLNEIFGLDIKTKSLSNFTFHIYYDYPLIYWKNFPHVYCLTINTFAYTELQTSYSTAKNMTTWSGIHNIIQKRDDF